MIAAAVRPMITIKSTVPEACVAFTHVVGTRLRKQLEHRQSREWGGKHDVWPLRNVGRIGHGGLRLEARPDFVRAIQGERIQASTRKTGGQIALRAQGGRCLWSHPPLDQHRLGLRGIVLNPVITCLDTPAASAMAVGVASCASRSRMMPNCARSKLGLRPR